MRICLELTSSGSQLALHRKLSKGLTVFCGETRQSCNRWGSIAVAIAPRRAARADAKGRQASLASPVARFPSTRPARDTPTSGTRPRRS